MHASLQGLQRNPKIVGPGADCACSVQEPEQRFELDIGITAMSAFEGILDILRATGGVA
jgi:hypothetical protein